MADLIKLLWVKYRNAVILTSIALLLAYCYFPKNNTSLNPNFYKKGKEEAFGQVPRGIKVRTYNASILDYKNRYKFWASHIGTKRTMKIILERMGVEYLNKLKKRHDIKDYYSQWTHYRSINEISESSPIGHAALNQLRSHCNDEKTGREIYCRILQHSGFYYSFSKKGIVLMSDEKNTLLVIFAVNV
ncbi:MAG: hypothetical protein GY750_20480 [Lentisphaerae bacterium]|nr:hypothetical protein [Lentisphaerota bacterium]